MKRKMSITLTAGIGALVVAGLASRPFANVPQGGTPGETAGVKPATAQDSLSTEVEIEAGATKSILQGGPGTNIRVYLLCRGSGGSLELSTGSEKRIIASPDLTGSYVDLGAGSTLKGTVTGSGGKFTVKIINLSFK